MSSGLARNTAWSLAGLVLPGVVSIVTVPMLVHGFGAERFGLLSLAFVLIGYASLFDLGLGRAVTHEVAQLAAAGRDGEIARALWTALVAMLAFGLAMGALAALAVPWFVTHVTHVAAALNDESRVTFYVLAASIPLVVVGAGVRGALEGLNRFDLINVVRVPTGVLTFLGPLAVLHYGPSILWSVVVLVVIRLVMLLIYGGACLRLIPALRTDRVFDRSVLRRLMSFGAWMTVSNVLSPLLVVSDRFLISAQLTVTAVTFYATPFDALTRLLVVPAAISGVLFPAFSAQLARRDSAEADVFGLALRLVFLVELPIVFIVVTFAPELLHAWLGAQFVATSVGVTRWIMIGVLANSLGQIAFSLVQGAGRADLTAKAHAAELPLYLIALFVLLRFRGIEGAGLAWCLRAVVDFVVLLVMSVRLTGRSWRATLPNPLVPITLLAFVGLGAVPLALWLRAALVVIALSCTAVATWQWGIGPTHRQLLWRRLRRNPVIEAPEVDIV